MRRRLTVFAVAILFSLSPVPLAAVSNPVVTGSITGIELCPKSICGVAIFAGDFDGEVNFVPTTGVFWTGVAYDFLPDSGECADITGGTWLIRTQVRIFYGKINWGGSLCGNVDPANTFTIHLTMQIRRGGSGELTFDGLLDHNPFILYHLPPTIEGDITQ